MFGAERTLAVTVKANVTDYVGRLRVAERATTDFARKATSATEGLAKRAVKSAGEHRDAWDTLGGTATGAGVALGAAVAGVVVAYGRFDQQLSKVRAVSGASANEMKALSAAALQAGKDTTFSASEAAAAEAELAKVGLTASQIVGGSLKGALDLAAAGGLDLAEAANVAGRTMKTFGLQAKDVPKIADALAAGANKSAADVGDLTQALSQVGLVAHQTGMSMEDTVGTLSAFADNALLGSDAGTSLKTMLQRLVAPTSEARAEMDKLGINAFNAQGQFVGIANVAGQLQTAMKDLSTEERQAAMAVIFGSDAVRAAGVLYQTGEQGIRKYIDGVKDVGAASRVASIQTDNLAGDFERLKGALETSLIQSGGAANGVLRELTQGLTAVVETVDKLPGPIKQGTVIVAGLTAAVLLTGGALSKLVIRAAETRAAMASLGLSTGRATSAMTRFAGVASKAATGIAIAGGLDAIIRSGDGAAASIDKTTAALLDLKQRGDLSSLDRLFQGTSNYGEDNVKGLTDALQRMADPGLQSRLNKLSSTVTGGWIKSGFEPLEDQFRAVGDALGQMVDAGKAGDAAAIFSEIAKRAQAAGMSVEDLSKLMPGYSDALARAGNTARDTSGGVEALKQQIEGNQEAAAQAAQDVDAFSDALDGLYGRTYSVAEAQDATTRSLRALAEQAKESKGRVRGNSEAALDLRDSLRDTTKTMFDQIEAFRRNGATQAEVAGKARSLKESFIATATAAGISKEDVAQYAAVFDQIPEATNTAVNVSGVWSAIEQLRTLKSYIGAVDGVNAVRLDPKVNRVARASGGLIPGPPSTADTVPAMVSTGEYVVRAAAVQRVGVGALNAINATGVLPARAYAGGGYVTRTVTAPTHLIPAPAAAGGGPVERHNHYHLDGAAVAATARGYAVEVARAQARLDRTAAKFGAPRA